MKTMFAVAVFGIFASASPVTAKEAPWYVGVDAGIEFVEKLHITPIGGFGYTPGPQVPTSVKASNGLDIDLVVGRQFDHVRIEAEIGNKTASNDNYTSAGYSAYPKGSSYGVIFPGSYSSVTGHQNVLSGMVNGLADFGKSGGIRLSAGGGIGVARVQDSLGVNSYGAVLRDSHTGFAWQLLGGVRVPVGKNVDLGVKYRFFNATGINLSTLIGTDIKTSYHAHSVLIGLSLKFGHGA